MSAILATAPPPPADLLAGRRGSGLSVMPDFVTGTHAFRHTLHSALASLALARVSASRITLRSTGNESVPRGTVVGQRPAPGTPLDDSDGLQLDIAGTGYYHHLPFGLWDTGGEQRAGTREMLEPIDDPLLKLTHWSHEGALLFRIAPDDLAACARWMALFGVRAEDWPRELRYPLASLLGSVAGMAGTREGIALLLQVLFGLPVYALNYRPTRTALPADLVTRLGTRASRLGVSTVVGDAIEDLATLDITLGTVSLAQYERFAEGAGRTLLDRALRFLVPVSLDYAVSWRVLDQRRAPRLGSPAENSRLGINCHMGTN